MRAPYRCRWLGKESSHAGYRSNLGLEEGVHSMQAGSLSPQSQSQKLKRMHMHEVSFPLLLQPLGVFPSKEYVMHKPIEQL